jgi:ribonuclease G
MLKSQSKEEYFFKVNKEAAIEAAKQIRLRNLSGIIIIDFINMKDESNLDKIMKVLEKEFMSDPLKVNVIDRTALGLVEITREKKYASLNQQLTS